MFIPWQLAASMAEAAIASELQCHPVGRRLCALHHGILGVLPVLPGFSPGRPTQAWGELKASPMLRLESMFRLPRCMVRVSQCPIVMQPQPQPQPQPTLQAYHCILIVAACADGFPGRPGRLQGPGVPHPERQQLQVLCSASSDKITTCPGSRKGLG